MIAEKQLLSDHLSQLLLRSLRYDCRKAITQWPL